MTQAIVVVAAVLIFFIARLAVRLFLPKAKLADKSIKNRMILVVSVVLAVILLLLFHKPIVDVILLNP